jgi:hypothetical protein
VAGKTGAGPSGDDPERGRPGSPSRSGLHDGPVARAFSPPQKAAGRADARRARKSFNDQRNAGGEPNAADISDQEYRVVAWVRGSRREDVVDREIAVSRQRDGITDWRALDGKRPVRQWPTDQRREDALPTIRPNRVAAGKK